MHGQTVGRWTFINRTQHAVCRYPQWYLYHDRSWVTWELTNDGLVNIEITSLALDPNNPP